MELFVRSAKPSIRELVILITLAWVWPPRPTSCRSVYPCSWPAGFVGPGLVSWSADLLLDDADVPPRKFCGIPSSHASASRESGIPADPGRRRRRERSSASSTVRRSLRCFAASKFRSFQILERSFLSAERAADRAACRPAEILSNGPPRGRCRRSSVPCTSARPTVVDNSVRPYVRTFERIRIPHVRTARLTMRAASRKALAHTFSSTR